MFQHPMKNIILVLSILGGFLLATTTTSNVVAQVKAEDAEASSTSQSHQSEILDIKLFDGETLTGKLQTPSDQPIKQLVIFVHGTGPGTFLNHRKFGSIEFNYFDLFAKEFNDRGIAFFSYNKRGVSIGDKPPMHDEVDREKFKQVVPNIEGKDLGTVIKHLKNRDHLSDAKVVLFGWSEGTIIAAMVAENPDNNVDALLLAGYAHENMFDIIAWQMSGAASMINLNPVFDADDNGSISKDEYESTSEKPSNFRTQLMQGTAFEILDSNKDGDLSAEDFGMRIASTYEELMNKIGASEDDWIWNNYFRVSSNWLHEHFAQEPTKTRLLRLDIPIFIFHGIADANVPVEGVHDLKRRFAANSKTNLETFVFEGHDHDLNFLEWPMKGTIPKGIQTIFEVAAELSDQPKE